MLFRLLFVFSLLVWGVIADSLAGLASLLLISILFMLSTTQGIVFIRRSGSLLVWLIIPIMMLHAVLTPGIYIFATAYLPVTFEGLNQGIFLSLHMLLMYFAAALLLRLILQHEWFALLSLCPRCEDYIKPKLFLLQQMKTPMLKRVRDCAQQWKKSKDYSVLPSVITQLLAVSMQESRQQAASLWYDWENTQMRHLSSLGVISVVKSKDWLYLVVSVLGWGWIWNN